MKITVIKNATKNAKPAGSCPIYVDDRPSLKIQELLASARLYIRRQKKPWKENIVDARGVHALDKVGLVSP